MHTSEWARHWRAIEDARDEHDTQAVSRAIRWAIANDQPEATDLYAALAAEFYAQGNSNASSCETNRAIEIILDAHLSRDLDDRAEWPVSEWSKEVAV